MVEGEWTDNCDWPRPRPCRLAGGSAASRRRLSKDQSYALYSLTQDELSHAMFPLGGLTKKEVRRIAAEPGRHGREA
jgi:hypothetical protein